MMVSLLNAGFLPWLAAAGVPIVVHLLTRRARRRVDLPTLRFLQKSLANQSKLWRWRHWITLLLRTLAIGAIVAVFLKPTMVSAFTGKRGERAGVVIVLDDSESMMYAEGGSSTFTKAKSQAREALRTLTGGDRANVILCGAQPTALSDTPTEDLGRLDSALQDANAEPERGDAAAAISMAVEQLGKTNTAVRKLIIVSDFQRTNWADVHFESVPSDVAMAFVSADSGHRENVGITSLRARPATPRVGEATSVEAEVFNSSEASRRVPIDLKLSDGRHFADTVLVAPYSTGTAAFPLTFDKPERVELTATISDDNLAADNVRHATVDLRQVANIVLLTDEDINADTAASFYLSRALRPDPSANSGFRVLPVHPKNLNNPTLAAADAVIVCNTPSMPTVQYETLARYVQGGGNLVWLMYGDRVADELTGFGKQLPKAEPLPFRTQSVMDVSGQGQGFVRLSEARYESRLLKAFRDTGGSLSAAKFTKFWITSEVDPRAEVLLKYDDGTVAAVRTGEGSGNLLLLNLSPAPGWSDLAKQNVFVPLVHEFLKGILLRDSGQREAFPGGAASTTIAPTKVAVTCQNPAGHILPVTLDKASGSVVLDRVTQPGFYRLYAGVDEVASIPVNGHPDESDLRGIDPRELESKRQRQASVMGAVSGGSGIAKLQKGIDLWPWLLAVALGALYLEQVARRVGVKTVKRGRA